MTLPAHMAKTVEHGTPTAIVEMARRVMGGIDCDPCSSDYWNDHVVHAWESWDETQNALRYQKAGDLSRDGEPMWARFFINPPGGKIKDAWRFAVARWQERSTVFWVGFSLEQLVYLQREGAMYPGFSRCIPPRRLAFLRKVDGGPPVPGKSPTHGNFLLLMPSEPGQVERFNDSARELGCEAF